MSGDKEQIFSEFTRLLRWWHSQGGGTTHNLPNRLVLPKSLKRLANSPDAIAAWAQMLGALRDGAAALGERGPVGERGAVDIGAELWDVAGFRGCELLLPT
ncbi:MAG: hypothetical protein KME14_01640 [Tildeniella torsiva UHER 1998/13D]|jgi:hypothetical protein|nr:hypothetical protein [Tildeniella torsiva UHER 1998/13D]